MKTVKNILAGIWCIWGLVTFVITFLIIFLPAMLAYLMPKLNGQRYFIRISKYWMRCWLFLIGCQVKVTGQENFIEKQNYIVVFNHNALLDVPLSSPFVPGPNKTIAKASFAKIPLFGWFYRKGSVLVDRSNEKSRSKSLDAMKAVLASGMHMCIYPEGTRNRTRKPMKKFYDGAFILAVATRKKVIPCIITGTKKATPIEKKFYLMPTPLKMHFLSPVSPENISASDLNKKVFELMQAYYVNHSPD